MRLLVALVMLTTLLGTAVSTGQDPQDNEKRRVMFADNQFFSKGGIGIITKDLYIDLRSSKNELRMPAGKEWTGKDSSIPELVFVFDGRVWAPDVAPGTGFDLSKSIVISFETDKVRFFDFAKESGGYYRRPNEE